ncbi:hypothetical protein [Nocardia miyunensis]|uniref:hypothetical protein n=1 Tax=Nocardia miyunensis TaxID=282684 RepID=UPI0008373810|nr:hypothetical protein [Nocardia miyunensis]
MSAPEGEDPGREFVMYLHTATTQVTASAMRTRADHERRDRDRRESLRNRMFDESRARRDARYEADAARRAAEHDVRMKLHHARLQETRERLRSVQQARTFAAGAGDTREFQHTFDELVGSFAAAVATRDLSPEHAERARLLGEQLREKTGLDPEKVIADAQQRADDRPGWVDSGHEVTAELADRLVEMHLDGVRPEAATPTGTEEGTDIADRIDQARVGQSPLEPEATSVSAPSQRADEPIRAEQAEAASAPRTRRGEAEASSAGPMGTGQGRSFAELLVDSGLWRRLLRPRSEPTPQSKPKFVPSERVHELMPADRTEAASPPDAGAGAVNVGSTISSVTSDGAEIVEHIDRARVGEPALGSEEGPVFVASERLDEPILAAQLGVVSDSDTGQGVGL